MASQSKCYNKTILIGRLGADPELKTGGKSDLAHFSICNATIDKDGREEVQWHRVKAFGKQAHLCKTYLHKGDLCCVEGRLDARPYEKNGEKRIANAIILEKLTFLTSKHRPETAHVHNTSELDAAFSV